MDIPFSLKDELLLPGLFIVLLAVAGAAMGLWAQGRSIYAVGWVPAQAIVARVPFLAVDQTETERRRADARDRSPAVYDLNHSGLEQVRERLKALGKTGADISITSLEQIPEENQRIFQLTPEALNAIRQFQLSAKSAGEWDALVDKLVERLAEFPLLDAAQAQAERDPVQRASRIILRIAQQKEHEHPDNMILALDQDVSVLRERIQAQALSVGFPRLTWKSIEAAVLHNLQPFYLHNESQTRLRRQFAYENDEPAVERRYQANEVIVRAGMPLSDFDVRSLEEERRAYRTSFSLLEQSSRLLGLMGVIALIGAGLWTYARAYNRRVVQNPTRGLALTGLLCLGQALAVLSLGWLSRSPAAGAAFATLLATIVLAIAYDPRMSMVGGAAMALILAVALPLSLSQTLVLLVGAGVAAALLDQVRTRSKILLTGGWAGLAMAVVTLFLGLLERPLHPREQLYAIAQETWIALAMGILSGLVVQSLLPAIEKIFKVTTAMTLKELQDASHPLLRRLAQEAPGTYQHSLRLADLSQVAADAIGANALLCKVAALYHDVGKLHNPGHFVENQTTGNNPHLQLSPRQSVDIILQHVRDGADLAREHNLPTTVRHLIESHHGTTLVEFFHHAACQEAMTAGKTPPPEEDFRYDSPKPRTREAAILMLCDSIESAARTMTKPDLGQLDHLVRAIAAKRLADGQFDDCNLTLADFRCIQTAVARTLAAMHHNRIAYPSNTPVTAHVA